jgi:hypothetical protein
MKSQLDMYIANQREIVKEYDGQIIALKDGEVLGAYPTKLAALRAMQAANYPPGSFMIVKCTPGDEEYTAIFHNHLVSFEQIDSQIS